MSVDAVVTHHTDGFRSGVARFNELLAEKLGVPLLGLEESASARRPLLSFKASELSPSVAALVDSLLAKWPEWEAFLHEFRDAPLERRIVEGAARVHCGNLEIEAAVQPLNEQTQSLWTPGLLNDDRPLPDAELTVFSFGMAHKIRADMFRRLRELLDRSGRSYAVFVSAANHETVSMRDAEDVFAEMHEIFPDELFFLGNLSDVAVAAWLARTTFFAAFFTPAVRANNTSVASAMERGAVVLTNLDNFSPPEYVHMENVVDIGSCDTLPSTRVLERLSVRAVEAGRVRGWDVLVERLR